MVERLASVGGTPSADRQAPSGPPLLSICIPTYKRADFVEAQVQSVFDHFLTRMDVQIELVVVNNKSPDDTAKRLERFHHPRFRLINRDVHYDTAEENMIRSLEYVVGEYVWFLSDDDPIHLATIDNMLSLLRERRFGCLVFNSTTIRPAGHIADLQPMPMRGPYVASTIDRIVEMIGLVNTFAGLSNIIHRRTNLSMEQGLACMKTSKIYSHVAWFVESHSREAEVAFVNSPIVLYRLNDYSDGHWDRVAEKQQVQTLFFWSLGIVRLLTRLVDGGKISAQQAGQIFELAEGGFRYRLIDDIVFKTFTQLLKAAQTGTTRERFSKAEFREIQRFCMRCDPSLYNMIETLAEAQRLITSTKDPAILRVVADKLNERFLAQYNHRQEQGQFVGRFLSRLDGFDVFALPLSVVAIRSDMANVRDVILRQVDPAGDGLNVLVDVSYEALNDQIVKLRADQNAHRAIAAMLPGSTAGLSHVDNEIVRGSLAEMRRWMEESQARNRDLSAQIAAVYQSSSWRVTTPMRAISRIFRRKSA